jgi:hypothetical protein
MPVKFILFVDFKTPLLSVGQDVPHTKLKIQIITLLIDNLAAIS